MTTFEEQLVNAIKHGCPECGETRGFRESRFRREYCDSLLDTQGQLRRINRTTGGDLHNVVYCNTCGKELYNKQQGWIPELQPIVKKEGDEQ